MPIRKGHVAPQNTFVNYIIRKFETLGRKFIIANARTSNCAIIYANDGFCNLTGFTRSDIMQKSCWCDFLYGRRTSPVATAEMKTCLVTKLEVNCEVILYRQNKTHFLCQVLIVPVKNENEEVVMLVLAFEELGPDNPVEPQRKFSVFQNRTSRLLSLPMSNISQIQSKLPNMRTTRNNNWANKRSNSVVHAPAIDHSHQMGSSRMYPPSNVITETSISVTNADSDEDKKANSSEEVSHVESVKLRPLLDGNRSVTTPSFETGKWSMDERMNVEDSNHKTGKTISSQHGNEDSLNRSSPVSGGPSNSRCVNSDQEPVIDQMRSRSKTLPVPTRHPVRKMETAGGDCSSTDAIESATEDNTSHHLSAGKGKKRRRSFVNLIPQTLPLPKSDFLTRAVSQLSIGKHSKAPSLSDVSNITVTDHYDEDHLRNFRYSVKNKFAQVLSLGLDVLPEYKVQPPRIHPWTVLHYSPFKAAWDWLILILVIYTAISTPYVAAFVLPNKQGRLDTSIHRYSDPITLIDMLVDILFIIDIIINFRTTYVNSQEEVISAPSKIAAHYFKGWFLIDLVAAVPFDLLLFGSEEDETTTLIALLKTARLLRLVRVARKLDRYSEYGPAVLILLMCSFSLIAHWLACIWYAIANMERPTLEYKIGWIDQLGEQINQPFNDSASEQDLLMYPPPTATEAAAQLHAPRAMPGEPGGGPSMKATYITALYFTFSSLTSVGFGNISPNTNAEKVFSILVMLIGSLMYASIFGNVSAIIQRLYSGTSRYHTQLRRIREFIKFHQIKNPLKNKLEEYFQHEWNYRNGIDMRSVLLTFPECLQADIRLHLNNVLLSKSNVFTDASLGCKRALALKFETTSIPPGDSLIFQGDRLDTLYFIARGSIEILGGEDDEVVAILDSEDVFGDGEAFAANMSPRAVGKSNYVVRALTYCDLHKIRHEDLLGVLDWYPEFTQSFYEQLQVTFSLRDTSLDTSGAKPPNPDMIPMSQLDHITAVSQRMNNYGEFHRRQSQRRPFHPQNQPGQTGGYHDSTADPFSYSDSRVNTVGMPSDYAASPKMASSDVNLQRGFPGLSLAPSMSLDGGLEPAAIGKSPPISGGGPVQLSRGDLKVLHSRMSQLENKLDEMELNITSQLHFITQSLMLQINNNKQQQQQQHHLQNINNNNTLYPNQRHQPHSLQQPHLHNSYSFGGPAKSPFVPSPLVTSGTDDIASGGDHFSRLLTETKLTEPTNTISKSSSSHC